MKFSGEELPPPPRIVFGSMHLPAAFSFRQEPMQGVGLAERPLSNNQVNTNANTIKRGMSFLICMSAVYW